MGHATGAGLCLRPGRCWAFREGAPPPLLGHRSLHACDIYRGGPFFKVPWATPPGRMVVPEYFLPSLSPTHLGGVRHPTLTLSPPLSPLLTMS